MTPRQRNNLKYGSLKMKISQQRLFVAEVQIKKIAAFFRKCGPLDDRKTITSN